MTPAEALAYAYAHIHTPPDWRDDAVQDAMLLLCERKDKGQPWEWQPQEVALACKQATNKAVNAVNHKVISLDALLNGEEPLTVRLLASRLGYGG